MRILKHGDLKDKCFTCDACGCEFIANMNEYSFDGYNTFEVVCPDCNTVRYIYKRRVKDYPRNLS